MTDTRPSDQDVAAQQLAQELGDAIHEELLQMVQLLQQANPASLFGSTEFTIRDLAL